jgi:uncharacterized protein HemY
LFRNLENTWAVARELNNLGRLACHQGHYERAAVLLEEGLALARDQDPITLGRVLTTLGLLAYCREDYGGAMAQYKESMLLWRQVGHEMGVVECLENMARVAVAQDQPKRAARLCGAASALRATIGAPLTAAERTELDRTVAVLRVALGEDVFAAAWAAGAELRPERAVAYALGEDDALTTSD